MGTSIELSVGNVSLSYSKNHMGIDYGFLFQDGDLTRRKSESLDYEYYDENPELKHEIERAEETFVRALCRVIPRLNILGCTLDAARAEYNSLIAEAEEISSEIDAAESKKEYLTFEEFCQLACRYPLTSDKA